MTNRYPHDDDWGDYELERRRAKALDKRHDAEILAAVPPALRGEVQHSLDMVRLQAHAMDLILAAFDRQTTREIDVTCPLCGQRELRHTRDPKAPGSVMAVCTRCTEV